MSDRMTSRKIGELSAMIKVRLNPPATRGGTTGDRSAGTRLRNFCKNECSVEKVLGCAIGGNLPAVPEGEKVGRYRVP